MINRKYIIIDFIKSSIANFKEPFELARRGSTALPKSVRTKFSIYTLACDICDVLHCGPKWRESGDYHLESKWLSNKGKRIIQDHLEYFLGLNDSITAGLTVESIIFSQIIAMISRLSASVNLLLSKKVYCFTDELVEMLISTDLPKNITHQDLCRLPASCIAITAKIPLSQKNGDKYIDGCFIHLECPVSDRFDSVNDNRRIAGLGICDSNIPLALHPFFFLTDELLSDIVAGKSESEIVPSFHYTFARVVVKLLFYLASDKIDAEELEYRTLPPKKAIKKGKKQKKQVLEVSESDIDRLRTVAVGQEIAAAVRAHKEYSCQGSSAEHSSKRPHVRAGHYHTFWIGKKDEPNRKAVRRWLPSMFINAKLK